MELLAIAMALSPSVVESLRERAERFAELTDELSRPEVASDAKRMPVLLRERGSLERSALLHERMTALIQRREEADSILADGSDAELIELARDDLAALEVDEAAIDEDVKLVLISDPTDDRTRVIFEIRAGTGGDEATLFAADLYRMYCKYFESKRWKVEQLDAQSTEVGGFKELTFGVEGEGAWRSMRLESGGHRVQRVPSTETQGRIHTSAATVAVLPEAEEAEIDLRDQDLRVDTMRSSGPGGQSVNKTSSAVRITHLPTDTVVVCQDEKSQHKNRAKAMRILRSRLLEAEERRLHDERAAERKSKVGSGDRSARVRTYNFPQNRVTDHRLGQNFSLEQVIDGRLGKLLDALEALEREQRLADL
ncbi:MAG: peptide chain release factor 1 [Chlamydiales bacterium]